MIHKGHRSIIDKAFETAGRNGSVFIGLATGELIKNKRGVKPLIERKKILEEYLEKKQLIRKTIIIPIKDRYGLTLTEDFDAIVVSPETTKTAEEINTKRIQKGKKPMKIIQIPFVLAEDGKPISTTRIINREIDENGIVLKRD